jgi:hypothetical protein
MCDRACARLSDNCHFNLARILQGLLYLARNIAGETCCCEIIDLIGLNEDPDLSSSLDRKGLFDPVE